MRRDKGRWSISTTLHHFFVKKQLPACDFNDLLESVKEGVDFAKGKITARTFTIEDSRPELKPGDIGAIR